MKARTREEEEEGSKEKDYSYRTIIE